ncbi:hypothetical protein [Methanotorris igneus]|uniref:Uncharacterized protein n=1 Tax=Methanotorris igneus (strain DSM 5666 / JCM 11834 / Kol 5) TaxID=880724 RepID=F6BBS9_METIK|nr:hypothetical protein [Methanotorris igneus]AEF97209.1 hypothetical protein Metig_1677 [Methanotorris igneus Kol 5]
MTYLVVVDYEKDSERKRIDYLIERWSNRGSIEKIRKMAIIVDVDNIDDFIKDIMSRLEGNPEEKVKVYEIKEVKKTIPSKKITLNYEVADKKEVVEGFLKYLMAKIGASYECSINDTKKYEAYTKKGSCSISIKLKEKGNKLIINFEIEGYGESVDLIKNKIDNDMKLFIEGLL